MTSFLQSIPAAATSPYALVAYTIAAVLFLFAGARLRMAKMLLAKIEAVPEAERRRALEIATGTVLPSHISPEQWIRLKRIQWTFLLLAAVLVVALTVITIAIVNPGVNATVRESTSKIIGAVEEAALATQPLTELSLQLKFSSSDASLRKRMSDGQDRIRENDYSSQGGVPRVPLETVNYDEALLPLLTYIGRIGPQPYDDIIERDDEKVDKNSLVLLIPIDESQNAILSFAHVSPEVEWYAGLSHADPDAARDRQNRLDAEYSMPTVLKSDR